jgi:pantoate ligase/cytidylate kinase
MLEAVGHPVQRLVRMRIGPVRLGTLASGQHRALYGWEVAALLHAEGGLSKGPSADEGRAPSPLSGPRSGSRCVVAIDGPSASGKSTVGALLAEQLGALFLDTGVFYRVVTLLALDRGIDPSDARGLAEISRGLDVRVRPSDPDGALPPRIVVGKEERDVTKAIRTATVEAHVSTVSSHSEVRSALIPVQRRSVESGCAVVVGRDIGTVIFPRAELKVFLDASAAERARRRAQQLGGDVAQIERAMHERDERDKRRAVAALRPAPDAVVLATDGLTVEEVVARLADLATTRCG